MHEHALSSAKSEEADNLPLSSVNVIGLLYNWEVFGQERANIEVFKCLRALGANVVVGVTTMNEGGDVALLLRQLGFETFDLPFGCQWSQQFFRREPWLFPKNLAAVCRCSAILAQQIKDRKCSLLLIGNPLIFSFISLCLMRNRKLPMVYRMGDEPPSDSKPNLWIWKRCFRRAKVVVANSQFVQRTIASAQADSTNKVRLIYNVAPSASKNGQANIDALTAAELDCESLRVLYVGQISEHKGVSHLLNAALSLCPMNRSLRFDFVGGSLYTAAFEEHLKNQVVAAGLADRIVFHGRMSDPSDFYQQATVLVVPSLFEEPAANVVLEAKRLGVPAIVYPSGGLPELIQHGITGLICKEKTITSLLQHLQGLLDHPETFRQMKDACLLEYEQRFSEERFHRQWLETVNAVLTNR